MAVHGRWPLMTGVAEGRYYCTTSSSITRNASREYDKMNNFSGGVVNTVEAWYKKKPEQSVDKQRGQQSVHNQG